MTCWDLIFVLLILGQDPTLGLSAKFKKENILTTSWIPYKSVLDIGY